MVSDDCEQPGYVRGMAATDPVGRARVEARAVLAQFSGQPLQDLHYPVMAAAAYRRAKMLAEQQDLPDALASVEAAWAVLNPDDPTVA
jgi:hypothetical protein